MDGREANKGDAIVKIQTLIRYACAAVSALLVASCGGGGASTDVSGGPLTVQPATATAYGGVPFTFQIVGGRPPYTLVSSEPSLFPVPSTFDGHSLTVVPANPGVVDSGLKPEELQVRTVNITARSLADNSVATAVYKVGQNFLTGYGFFFTSTTCGTGNPCAGGESTLHFDATFAGNLQPGRTYRIERVRGPFQFVDPLNTNNQVDAVTVSADENGKITTVIRVATGIPSQIGLLKITDVQTGAYVYDAFRINGTPANNGSLTPIPTQITLTGPSDKLCGYGAADVLVADGTAPYSLLTCTNPIITVSNNTSTQNPGRFTIFVGPSNICLNNEQCVFQDATGARVSIPITTVLGAAAPPLPTFDVQPPAITLTCGASGSVTAVGGSGSYSVNSTHPRITAVVSGNTITITRLAGPDPAGGPFPATGTVTVTDGSSIKPVTVTVPPAC